MDQVLTGSAHAHPANQVVEDIYAGTLDDAAWQRGMVGLAHLANGSGTLLCAFNPSNNTMLRDELHGLDPRILRDNRSHWDGRDLRLPAAALQPVGEAVTERDLGVQDQLTRSDFFNEFLLPNDIPHMLGLWLHKAPDKLVVVAIQGSRRRGPFDRDAARTLVAMAPHLRRALAIRDRLESAQLQSQTFAEGLRRVTFAVFVLDAAGGIIDTNPVAESTLQTETVIRRLRDNTLWLDSPVGEELRRWMRAGAPARSDADGLLHLPRRDGRLPLSVMVTRTPASRTTWISAGPQWLVFVFDPERRFLPAAEVIAKDLGITQREAEVATLMSIGCNLPTVAKRLGISPHTARTHAKAIFAKTGLRSQLELLRRVATGPAMLART